MTPNQPATPMRSVRVADDLWWAVTNRAAERSETVSSVIRRKLEQYLAETSKK